MYQHFVPQFLLRNFSHTYVDVESNETKPTKKQKKANLRMGKPVPGDLVVQSAALSKDPIKLTETPVKRILGQMDMYKDTSHPQLTTKQQNHIEDMFGRMESRVSTIFRKITKSFDAGDPGLWLTRRERNDVRKFLFLLKYRGSGFHRRFNHNTPDKYNEDDGEIFQEYLSERGFNRPIDVWLDNLKAIMELKMDAAGDWMDKIRKRIYHPDAEWFISHVQFFYMAICTPEDPLDEFIITDACYNVFEGYNTFANDFSTGQVDPVAYINLHEFTPISPKLMIVLRSFLLPVPVEDADPKIKELREDMRKRAITNVFGPEILEKTPLFHLPIKKAQNSYSTLVDGRLSLLSGEDGTHKFGDKFLFNFFPIKQVYVHKINGIFLDNAYTCSHAVFASRGSFLKSLEWYMTASPELIGKNVTVTDGDQRLHLLRKLDALMKTLGSDKTSVWDETPLAGQYNRETYRHWIAHITRQSHRMQDDPSLPPDPLLVVYVILGGSPTIFFDDLDQAKRMWILRIKIDSWSLGVDERIRQRNRNLLTEAYLRTPPWILWMYMKVVKFFHLVVGDDMPQSPISQLSVNERLENVADAMEDTLATARCLVKRDSDINHILYVAVTNEIEIKKRPGFNIWQNLVFTWTHIPRIVLIKQLVFDLPGQICCCGIPEIELLALVTERQLREVGGIEVQCFDSTHFTEDEVIEVVTRIKVRRRFTEVLKKKMKPTALGELKKAFFEFAYPTPPTSDI